MEKKKQKKKENEFWTTVQEIWHSPKGKALLFFGFYLCFFIFIGVISRNSSNQPKTTIKLPTVENTENYSLKEFSKGNYQFTYDENKDGVQKHFEGKSYNKMKELTSSLNQMYFLYSGLSLMRQNDVWQISESPFSIREIMEEDYLEEVLSKATFLSKTVYQNKEVLYHYEISTTTLYEIYHHEAIDLDDMPNTIDMTLSEEGEIFKIVYDYSNYETYITGNPTSSIIQVCYQDYGKVEPFEVPN